MLASLSVTPGSATPIYRQIVQQVSLAVANGSLAAGTGLPSVRALAERLTVNPNTVAKAYAELTRDGTVVSQPGRGVFVGAARKVFADDEVRRRLDTAADALVHAAVGLGASPDDVRAAVQRRLKEHGLNDGPGAKTPVRKKRKKNKKEAG